MLKIYINSRSGHSDCQDSRARGRPLFFVLELVAVVTEKTFLLGGQLAAQSCRESEQFSAGLPYSTRDQHFPVIPE